MRKILSLLTTTISFVCCAIWLFSSCTPESQDEFGDDYVARQFDQAIKNHPNQNIPWDLCGTWEKVDDGSYRYPISLMINSDGILSGIKRLKWANDGSEEDISFVGLCNYDLKYLKWAYRLGDNRVSTDEFNVAIYWDSDALILAETWAGVYSRDGEPVDPKIFSNRDSRLIGRWKSITGASRIVYNSDGTGSFNGSSFSNWCTIGDYVLHQYYGDEYYLVDAYRFSGDILSLDDVDPTYQDWDKNILNYARE